MAWGAHCALATKNIALVPALLSVAGNWQSSAQPIPGDEDPDTVIVDQRDRRDPTAAVLDALIGMRVIVPGDALRHLAADFPNYVAILLSRLPAEESQSLSFDLYRFHQKTETVCSM